MVWEAIAHDYKSEIVFVDGNMTARRYLYTILILHIRPYAGAIGQDDFIYVDNNAQPHRAHIMNVYLEN